MTAARRHRYPASVKSGIARSGNRSPSGAAAIHEDHMIEFVDRFKAEHERRISVLLEDDGGEERRLETMRAAVADDAAEASQRRARWRRFSVVREPIEVALHGDRRAQLLDDAPLARPERVRRRRAARVRSVRL